MIRLEDYGSNCIIYGEFMKSYIIKLNHKYYNIVNWRHIIENLVNFTPSKGIVVGEMETGLKAWNLNSRDGDFAVLALVLRWLNLSVMIKISIFFFKLNLFDFFDLLLVLRLTFSSEVFLKPLIEIILQNRWMQLKKFYLLHWASIISIEKRVRSMRVDAWIEWIIIIY